MCRLCLCLSYWRWTFQHRSFGFVELTVS